jgi:pimeloyl-ACP methyl ester carboxylesterase
MLAFIDRFWHQTLGRPYRLAKVADQGRGAPVILLHGIGRSGQVWQHLLSQSAHLPYRLTAFDLLGFGASPKPDLEYTIDDHADAVIASLSRLRFGQPVIIVGHSMGCLVAVRVARRRPDLVKHLILYEMPLYEGLPQKRRYRLRTDLYRRLYSRIVKYQPSFNAVELKRVEKLARKIIGFEVSRDSWQPFVRSLENTIMKQTAADDIKHLLMPMEVIYGRWDMLVIRGKPRVIFGEDTAITAHTIRARHVITAKSSHFLLQRVIAAAAEPYDG